MRISAILGYLFGLAGLLAGVYGSLSSLYAGYASEAISHAQLETSLSSLNMFIGITLAVWAVLIYKQIRH